MGVKAASDQRQSLWTKDFLQIIFANMFIFFGFHMLPPTLPLFVIEKLNGQETIAGMVIGIFTVSAMLIRPFAGRLVDTYGRRNIFLIGMVVISLCILAYIWAPSITVVLIIRLIHGLGWGITTTASSTIASDVIPRPRLGEGMGYFAMTANVAMSIAPAAALALISGGNFTLMFTVSAVCSVLAFTQGLFFKRSRVKIDPKAVKGTLFERSAMVTAITVSFLTFTYGAVASFIPIYAIEMGIGNIGLYYIVFSVTLLVVRSFIGRVADKRGFTVIIVPSLFLMMIAMLVLYQAASIWSFLLAAVFYALGFGGVQPSLQAMSVMHVQPQRRGAANATFMTGGDLGLGVGAIVWGAVAQATGFGLMYLLGIIPIALALIIYLVSIKMKGSR